MDGDSQHDRYKVVIIGSGNVATHLAHALDGKTDAGRRPTIQKVDIVQVMSRTLSNAHALASTLTGAEATDDLARLRKDADFYIIAVNDDAITRIANEMPKVSGTVIHTSGSIPIQALEGTSESTGVFYPLQTFSKHAEVDMSQVPFFLEASDEDTYVKIESLARMVSENVYRADSESRKSLHISAVFACNFFNHLLHISSDILKENGYGLDVLKPLLQVTLAKALSLGPENAQTGPAARQDHGVMNAHMAALDPDKREIYRLLSESIMYESNKHKDNN